MRNNIQYFTVALSIPVIGHRSRETVIRDNQDLRKCHPSNRSIASQVPPYNRMQRRSLQSLSRSNANALRGITSAIGKVLIPATMDKINR